VTTIDTDAVTIDGLDEEPVVALAKNRRAAIALALLTLACVLVVVGVAMIAPPAAWICAGVLLAGLVVLVLGDLP
jgi:hypothetical protein